MVDAASILSHLPPPAQRAARRLADDARARRLLNRPRWGNIRRLRPFSARYGVDRGTPIDRWYLEQFIDDHRTDIRGRVLEVANARYAGAHRAAIASLDILDIDPRNDEATIIADLDDAGSLPPQTFDCVIVTQTLQYMRDVRETVRTLRSSLAPDGLLLLSVPVIAKVDHNLETIDRWRMLPKGLTTVLDDVAPSDDREMVAFGNVLAAVAFLLGIAAEELDPSELLHVDPLYPILTCAALRRTS